MIKVVLDTNVLISGLLWSGVPCRLLRLVDDGHINMCLNETMLMEFSEVMERKKFAARLQILGLESSALISLITEKATFSKIFISLPPSFTLIPTMITCSPPPLRPVPGILLPETHTY